MGIIKVSYEFTVDEYPDEEMNKYFFKRLHTTVMDALTEELPNTDILVKWDKVNG